MPGMQAKDVANLLLLPPNELEGEGAENSFVKDMQTITGLWSSTKECVKCKDVLDESTVFEDTEEVLVNLGEELRSAIEMKVEELKKEKVAR